MTEHGWTERRQQERRRTSGSMGSLALEASATARRHRLIALTVVMGALVTGLGWRWVVTAGLFADKTLPPQLVGVWRTSAPAYVDRALEFTATSVIFHTGGSDLSVHRIRRINRTQQGSLVVYRLEYRDRDNTETFGFRYIPAPRQLIRLDNLPFVWRKHGPP